VKGNTIQTSPVTGTLAYLSGKPNHIKLQMSGDTTGLLGTLTGGLLTSDVWVKNTGTEIKKWQTASNDQLTGPTGCLREVWAGDGKLADLPASQQEALKEFTFFAYPQCTEWKLTSSGTVSSVYSLECGLKNLPIFEGTLVIQAVVSSDNQLVALQQSSDINGITYSTTIIMTTQGTTPPVRSDFDLPSICKP
jgi:hypothetical protein